MRIDGDGKSSTRLLVVDDERNLRTALCSFLEGEGHSVDTAGDGREAMERLSSDSYDAVIADVRMPNVGGLELLTWIREQGPDVPVLMMSAHGDVADAVEAMKLGARDYVIKPFDPVEMALRVKRTIEERREREARRALERDATSNLQGELSLVAKSRKTVAVFDLAAKAAPYPSTVLITGESGTGKEVVARFIHERSGRPGAFIAINLGALPEPLAESELFGYEKGAFTGADARRTGLFEEARGGTLFLDEIGELPLRLQVKLLRAIQERKIVRLGSSRDIPVDTRLVAATNRHLESMVKAGEFREDLYYRLNVMRIELPPLRDRKEDIPELARAFAARFAKRMEGKGKRIGDRAMDMLMSYPYPGNVRELENVIERAMILADGDELEPSDFSFLSPITATVVSGNVTLAELERRAILEALERNGGKRAKTAEELGISRRTLLNKLTEYGVQDSGDD